MSAIENISDRNGRALEYCIVNNLIGKWQFRTDGYTNEDQLRDGQKFSALGADMQQKFERASQGLINWLDENYSISKAKTRILRRLKDNESKDGDVTDIAMLIDGQPINLSIKHNHSAIKHQRPGALPLQLGYSKETNEYKEYKEQYSVATTKFAKDAVKYLPSCTLYNELKAKDANYINVNLYKPICDLVSDFLNKYGKGEHAKFFFRFLVGNTNYHKIIVYQDEIQITQFADIAEPTSLKARVEGHSYVYVTFSNKWEISMRLHTASSRLSGVSIKFDTQPSKIDVPKTTVCI